MHRDIVNHSPDSPALAGRGRRVAPGEGDSQRASPAEGAPHPNPLPVRTGRGRNKHTFAFSRRNPPEFCQELPALHQRAQGMPGAGAPAAARVLVVSTRVSHHGHTGNTRHSPRNGFNGLLRALPGDRALLPPSPLRNLLLRNLMPASGHQDHTTSPSASCRSSHGTRRPPHPASYVRDDRDTPLLWARDGANLM
jgi:hypothetical protein